VEEKKEDTVTNRSLVTIIAIAFSGLAFVECDSGDDNAACEDTGPSDGGDGDTFAGVSVEQCIKTIGWQADYTMDADLNGITDPTGTVCTDAMTVEWYQEDPSGTTFDKIMAWDVVGSCSTRTPEPQVDEVLCTFHGTHTWEAIPGVDPSTRMILTETIDSVTGDFDGDGTDDQCGPAAAMVGTSIRTIVTLDGPCASGAKAWRWEPVASDTEAFPGDLYRDAGGLATPVAICSQPGEVGLDDHVPGRKICETSLRVTDPD
jgi:hypothetical protein